MPIPDSPTRRARPRRLLGAPSFLDQDEWDKTADTIRRDGNLTREGRGCSLRSLAEQYAQVFKVEPGCKDYERLKSESRFLAGLSQAAFVHMAHRLVIIRDERLYKADGYEDFRTFVQEELPISLSTAHNYIDVACCFQLPAADPGAGEIEYSKLLPALPLLRASDPSIPKDKIRERFLHLAKSASKRQILAQARLLKKRYGLSEPQGHGSAVQRILRELERALQAAAPTTASDLTAARRVRDLLTTLLGGRPSDS